MIETRNGSSQSINQEFWGVEKPGILVSWDANGNPTLSNDCDPDITDPNEGSETPADKRYFVSTDSSGQPNALTGYGASNGQVIERYVRTPGVETLVLSGDGGSGELGGVSFRSGVDMPEIPDSGGEVEPIIKCGWFNGKYYPCHVEEKPGGRLPCLGPYCAGEVSPKGDPNGPCAPGYHTGCDGSSCVPNGVDAICAPPIIDPLGPYPFIFFFRKPLDFSGDCPIDICAPFCAEGGQAQTFCTGGGSGDACSCVCPPKIRGQLKLAGVGSPPIRIAGNACIVAHEMTHTDQVKKGENCAGVPRGGIPHNSDNAPFECGAFAGESGCLAGALFPFRDDPSLRNETSE